MKISQPIFGILVVLTKNELTKICNEPGNHKKFEKTRVSIQGVKSLWGDCVVFHWATLTGGP